MTTRAPRPYFLFLIVPMLALVFACSKQDAQNSSENNKGEDMATADMSVADQGKREDQGSNSNNTTPGMDQGFEEPDLGPPPPPGMFALLGDRCAQGNWAEDLEVSPGMFGVGDFSLEVTESGRWRVSHASEPGRTIFALAEDQPLLYAARALLDAEEHQGSFDMSSREVETCQKPNVEHIYYDGQALVMQGGFADGSRGCQTLTFEFQACAAPEEGHLSWGVTTSNKNFNFLIVRPTSSADERIYGLGEQFPHDRLDLKGRAIPLLSQEGGVGRGHTPISPAVNTASPGSAGNENSTYYAAPHYITSTDRSLFLENSEYVIFDFRQEDHLALRLFAPEMNGRIIHGKSPLELIERYTEWAGRMPAPPQWINDGAVIALARPLAESEQIIADLEADGAEISAVWNQTWSGTSVTFIGEQVLWNWVQNEHQLPEWGSFVEKMNNKNIRVLCYINSMFRDVSEIEGEPTPRRNLFAEAEEAGHLVKKEDGSTYKLEVTAFDVGLLDLSNEAARVWMKDVIKDEMITRAGCQGWMADFAEALPFDAKLASGVEASAFHNLYPVEWAKLNREAVEEAGKLGEILVFNRSGWSRTPSHSIMLWQGDQLTTWDKYDGIKSALHGLLNGGFSGIALNHSDIGGYTSLSRYNLGYKREAELLKRWTELAAFTSLMRTHEGNQPEANAQIYSDAAARRHFARMTKIYKALGFYRAALFTEANQRGWPVVRHMMLEFPEDETAQTIDDQFMLGAELLVAPILEKCGDCDATREVYLPAGRWVHLWTGTSYGSTSSGTQIEITAPLGEPPVFYRRGSSIAAQLLINLEDAGVLSN